jgi:hypothetical protein
MKCAVCYGHKRCFAPEACGLPIVEPPRRLRNPTRRAAFGVAALFLALAVVLALLILFTKGIQ